MLNYKREEVKKIVPHQEARSVYSQDNISTDTPNSDLNDSDSIEYNHNSFKMCILCGLPISKERLKAIPNTLLCIRCKKKNELINPKKVKMVVDGIEGSREDVKKARHRHYYMDH